MARGIPCHKITSHQVRLQSNTTPFIKHLLGFQESPSWISNNQTFQKHPHLQILHRCSTRRHLEPILAYAIVSGLFRNPFVTNSILHSAAGDLPFVSTIFSQMTTPNAFSFNTMIRALSDSNPSAAFSMFTQMLQRSIFPDKHTFPFLLKCLNSSTPDLNLCKSIHALAFILGFKADPFVQTGLLTTYIACDDSFGDAMRILDEMPYRDVVCWTAAISGFAARGCYRQAIAIFNMMRFDALNARPNVATAVSALSASAGLGALELTRTLHSYVEKAGLEGDVFVRNSLIDSYAKCGGIGCSRKVFDGMSYKDLFSWSAMITGLASHGLGKEALDVFVNMERTGVVPDSTAFVAVLSACSHAGLIDEGIMIFETMQAAYEIVPGLKHYGCMVDLFSRAGLLDRAYEMVSSMPMEPNLVILGALLSACRVHGNLQLAKLVMVEIEKVCGFRGGAHVILSNMYANQDQWHEVVATREGTRREGRNKPQGLSWVEVRGVVHEFGVEDRLHPLAREMHLVLDGLGKLMEEILIVS